MRNFQSALSDFPTKHAAPSQSTLASFAPPSEVNFLQSYYDLKLPKKKMDMKPKAGARGPSASNLVKSIPLGGSALRSASKGKSALSRKKKETTTNFDEKNPNHMVEKIELSNFRGKNFSRAGLREFLEGIEDMRCLSTVTLKNNGINDDFIEELGIPFLQEMLFSNERVKSIDLSGNDIGKQGALAITRKLKEFTHIEWLE